VKIHALIKLFSTLFEMMTFALPLWPNSRRIRRTTNVMFADAVGQQDQPVDRLPLGRGKVGTSRQDHGRFAELRPAAIEIDQVTGCGLTLFPTTRLPGIPTESAHFRRLMQSGLSHRVKKA
jgi:hypothetical protein